jgi:large subunit ribosomal protein L44e
MLTCMSQVNVPKTRRTYCKGKDCKKHTQHKVTREWSTLPYITFAC